MSVSGISSTNFYTPEGTQTDRQQFQQAFQQLGQDLQSGNLTAAQSDFATLQQLRPQTSSASLSPSNNPVAQAFSQLSQDLQSGNLSAAQQDYATIQQTMQSRAVLGHHHQSPGGGTRGASEIGQLLDQLGTALPSGKLSSAQRAFTTLQQEAQFNQDSGQAASTSGTGSNSISVDA
jgi:hypothetical protein